jgi:hypothetical protein
MVATHLTPRRSRAKLVVLHRRVLGGRPSAGGSRAEPRSHWRYAVSTGSTSRDPAGAGAAHNRVVPGGDGDWVACGDISGGGQIRGVATPPPETFVAEDAPIATGAALVTSPTRSRCRTMPASSTKPLTYPATTTGKHRQPRGRLGDHRRSAERSAVVCNYVC